MKVYIERFRLEDLDGKFASFGLQFRRQLPGIALIVSPDLMVSRRASREVSLLVSLVVFLAVSLIVFLVVSLIVSESLSAKMCGERP